MVAWRMAGDEVVSCNCAWGCPCQFNAPPTHGKCEAFASFRVGKGTYGDVALDGVKFGLIASWPAAIHLGNGTIRWYVDAAATAAQRDAIVALSLGKGGGTYFEIFAAVVSDRREVVVAPVEFTTDRERRVASVRVAGFGETYVAPIKNPVSGEEQRARIVLPGGFEYEQAEMGNSVRWRGTAGEKLTMEHRDTYAQLNAFDWSNAAAGK